MSVLAPCDPTEAETITRWCATQDQGPVYLRLGKAGEPDLTLDAAEPWEFGKLRHLTKGEDVCIVSYGPILKKAVELADKYKAQGKSVSIVSAASIKPFDDAGAVAALKGHKEVVVIEETAPVGSIGQRIKALAYECGATCKLSTFCLQDEFIHHYGNHDELLAAHGLETGSIAAQLGIG